MSNSGTALNKFVSKNVYYQLVNAIGLLAITLLISRIFKAELCADFYLFINTASFLTLILSGSIDSSLIYFAAKDHSKISSYASLSILWAVIAALIAGIIYVLVNKGHHPSLAFLNTFAFVLGSLLIVFFTGFYAVLQKQKGFYAIIVFFYLAMICLAIRYANQFNFFSHFYFIAVALQGIAVAVWFFLSNKIKFSLSSISTIEFPIFVKYAAWAFVGNLLFFLLYKADYWLVDYFVKDKTAVGNYVMVARLGQLFLLVPTFMGSSLFTFASGQKESLSWKEVWRFAGYGIRIIVLFAAPVLVWGGDIFVFIFGETFGQMYKPFLAILPGLLALTVQIPLGAYNSAHNQQYKNLISVALGAVTMLVLNLIYLPKGSIVTAALISSIAYSICMISMLLLTLGKGKYLK